MTCGIGIKATNPNLKMKNFKLQKMNLNQLTITTPYLRQNLGKNTILQIAGT